MKPEEEITVQAATETQLQTFEPQAANHVSLRSSLKRCPIANTSQIVSVTCSDSENIQEALFRCFQDYASVRNCPLVSQEALTKNPEN